jgi:DNA-binding transcriptional LysR family regulator
MNLLAKSGLSLERLRSLLAFAEAGSIVRAAGGDPVRSSLISRQLRELEEFFEVELVAKRGKGLILTEAGRRLTGLVREQFQALEDFGTSTAGRSVRLSLGAGNTILEWLVAPRLGPAAMEGVEFDLHHERQSEMIEHLQDGSLDLAIIAKEPLGRQFATCSLGSLAYDLFIPKNLASGSNLRQSLRELPLALPIGGRVREAVIKYAGELKGGTLGTTGYLNALASVKAGHYASVLPTLAASDLGATVRSIKIPETIIPKRQIVLAWKKRTAETRPAVEKAIRFLRELLLF